MSDEEQRDTSGRRAPNSLGTGSRSPSGTISLDSSSPTSSTGGGDLALSTSHSADSDTLVASDTAPPPTRQRLYSEEDEDLRKAKAMALAIQQNPNMTPEEIHQLHFGDEAQSQIISSEQHKKQPRDSFLGKFQKKMVNSHHGTTTSTAQPQQQTSSIKESVSAPAPAAAVVQQEVIETPTESSSSSSPKTSPVTSNNKKVKAMAAAKAKAGSGVRAAQAKAKSGATAAKDKAKSGAAAAKAKAKTAKDAMKRKSSNVDGASTRSSVVSSSELSSTTTSMNITESKSSEGGGDGTIQLTTTLQEQSGNKIRLSANVWKRRSGLGKLSYSKAWERRKVILQGSKLFYFKMAEEGEDDDRGLEEKDASWFEQAALNLEKVSWLPADNDPSAPRGYFDLLKEGTTVAASSGHSGAPSPFAISIKIKSDTYWKLCFDSHAMQMEWMAALTDVIVTASVDSYNANLLLAADPHHEATIFESEYMAPPGSRESGQRLWMTGAYRVSSMGMDEVVEKKVVDVKKKKKEADATAVSSLIDEEENEDRWILQEQDVRAVFVIVNAALISSRASLANPQYFWYILTFCNMGLGYYLVRGYKKRKTTSAPAVEASIRRHSNIVVPEEIVVEEEEITGFKPTAGSTTVKLEHPEDSPELDGQVFGAWCAPPGENLAVRSHGYLTTKEKIPSPGELYECVNVDIFESPHRYPDMARRVVLPKVEFEGEDPATKTWYAPDVFIVSVALPTDPPKMRSSNDGGGFTITMYFTMKQETRDILRRVTAEGYDPLKEPPPDDVQKSKVNAVKLFNEYCRRAPTDPDFQSRFKLVANGQNLKEIGMPSWIAKYNGKPVLIKRAGQTGFIFSHPKLSCMEFDVSFHPFPYLAKQAISYMKDSFFKKVLVTFGFVIEGRSDDELPECVIGLMQLCYPDPVYAIQGKDFFAGTSPTSF